VSFSKSLEGTDLGEFVPGAVAHELPEAHGARLPRVHLHRARLQILYLAADCSSVSALGERAQQARHIFSKVALYSEILSDIYRSGFI
jgi:hypothetical protein